ncbi:MAG: hypothetical protein ACTHK8_08165 [Ginsengibacter sp.]
MDKLEKLRIMLINSSIGISAVRNQGNGIVEPIRRKLEKIFFFDEFFEKLKSPNVQDLKRYLDKITGKITGVRGISNNKNPPDIVKRGTARKCVNLLFRSVVYNGFMWESYKLKDSDFIHGGLMDKLELPLDTHVANGIKRDCKRYGIEFNKNEFPSFTIISSNRRTNRYYQDRAVEIGAKRNLCRIDLDLYYWRSKDD